METFKSLPLAEVRQVINHKIDLQFTKMAGCIAHAETAIFPLPI